MGRAEILLVDDEQDILDIGILLLREAGFDAVPAISGDIALILLEQGLPFRLLITDIVMPGVLDGFGLARRAREILPDIRLIYTTGFAGVTTVRSRGAPYGMTLQKPWRSQSLVEAVATALPGTNRPASGQLHDAERAGHHAQELLGGERLP
jgi:DNA-binding NtrC family response regulator